jgi:hypothetical protein
MPNPSHAAPKRSTCATIISTYAELTKCKASEPNIPKVFNNGGQFIRLARESHL